LLGNYRNIAGTKFILCQNDVRTFLRISRLLHPYSDLCLQVVSSEYPDSGIDLIPFPMDKDIFFECSLGIGTRYTLTNDTARSKSTGNEGAIIMGWSLGLPEQAHQLILSSSAAELVSQKIFFLPYERHLRKDKLVSDFRLSKELGLIPVYFDSLPSSESVEVITSTTVKLPVLLPDEAESHRKQIRKVKLCLSQLLSSTKDSAQSSLNNLASEIDEMSDICVGKQSIEIKIYILDFPGVLQRESYIALVMSS